MSRDESLRLLEHEVGVLIRRIKKVIGERAQAVHEDLQPASYLMLGYLAEQGPMRASAMAETFHIDKGAISRQIQHLVDLGLVARTPDPEDGRATLVTATDDAVRRMADVADHRRKWLDEQLGDWSDGELLGFAKVLGRYNDTLNQT
ncbi:MarR family transcriptional regulator [Nocardioides sp.]|jgi:DNA-binding MarR family transcriptional regulator|uniref:MarR family winged helix-turn-helix transcriptional regulator n=1 Tax=Nocardioides sp. TaxID=35761 RepID=UPI0031FE981D|nr:MarR family transcriptional regulator [Nocardioides sp.]